MKYIIPPNPPLVIETAARAGDSLSSNSDTSQTLMDNDSLLSLENFGDILQGRFDIERRMFFQSMAISHSFQPLLATKEIM